LSAQPNAGEYLFTCFSSPQHLGDDCRPISQVPCSAKLKIQQWQALQILELVPAIVIVGNDNLAT
jgi:hypothetical protein